MIVVGFEKLSRNPSKMENNVNLAGIQVQGNPVMIPTRIETWQSSRGRIFSHTDLDSLTVQLKRVTRRARPPEGEETDEEKYITASEDSGAPPDTDNQKELVEEFSTSHPQNLSPTNSDADLKSIKGIRSNDDFFRVFKRVRFDTNY